MSKRVFTKIAKDAFHSLAENAQTGTTNLTNTLQAKVNTITQQVNVQGKVAYTQATTGIKKEAKGYAKTLIDSSKTAGKVGLLLSTGIAFSARTTEHINNPREVDDVIEKMTESSKKALHELSQDVKRSGANVVDSFYNKKISGKEVGKLGNYGLGLAAAGGVLLPSGDESSEKRYRPIHAMITVVNEAPGIAASIGEGIGTVVGSTLANTLIASSQAASSLIHTSASKDVRSQKNEKGGRVR